MIHRNWAVSALLAIASAKPLSIRDEYTKSSMVWGFKEITPSLSLSWTPCFQNFTCANLEVPLDYADPSAGNTNVAFLKHEAAEQPAMGDIIFNPGGPGGSGVNFVLKNPNALAALLGSKYNIVGMDPRGVNNSGPHIDCFKDKPWVRDYYDGQYSVFDPKSPRSMAEHFHAAGAFGEWCTNALGDDAGYANTPATATDMLRYTELLAESKGEDPKQSKLHYYGISYGSTLGTTYAALHPDRVGRMIIDGVVDVEDHYSGAWKENINDADKAIQEFFQLCHSAGPSCAFFKNDTSPADLEKRTKAIITDIEETPIAITDPYWVDFPALATAHDIKGLILLLSYGAVGGFESLAGALAMLENRNGSFLMPFAEANGVRKSLMPQTECNFKNPLYSSVQPRLVIASNDANGRFNISSVEMWEDYMRELTEKSWYTGEVWAGVITLQFRELHVKSPESQVFHGFQNKTVTSNPILFTGNRVDPVAPSMHKMSKFFKDSVVFTQDAIGHGLIAATSKCTNGYMTKFMETGELPPKDTVCDIDVKPFETSAGAAAEVAMQK